MATGEGFLVCVYLELNFDLIISGDGEAVVGKGDPAGGGVVTSEVLVF